MFTFYYVFILFFIFFYLREIKSELTKKHQLLEEVKNEIETLQHTLVDKKQNLNNLEEKKREMTWKNRIRKGELEERLHNLDL